MTDSCFQTELSNSCYLYEEKQKKSKLSELKGRTFELSKAFSSSLYNILPHFNKKNLARNINSFILFYVHIICKTCNAAKCFTDGLNVINMAFTFRNDRNVRFYKFTFLHNSVQILI